MKDPEEWTNVTTKSFPDTKTEVRFVFGFASDESGEFIVNVKSGGHPIQVELVYKSQQTFPSFNEDMVAKYENCQRDARCKDRFER